METWVSMMNGKLTTQKIDFDLAMANDTAYIPTEDDMARPWHGYEQPSFEEQLDSYIDWMAD